MCMRKHTEDYQTHACGYNVRTAVCGVVHYIVLCGDAQQFTRSCSQVQYSAMQRKATRHILLILYTILCIQVLQSNMPGVSMHLRHFPAS